ncbi:MAG: flagellum-specific ATP synthase [Flavobacterium sp.]|jgi:flagellum-specific ATP synthase
MPNIVTPEHRMLATKFRQHYSLYRRNEDLISVGAYAPGNDVELDSAVEKFPHLKSFLKQDITERLRLKPCLDKMGKIV